MVAPLGPSLALNRLAAGGRPTKAYNLLGPSIPSGLTFTRASTATYFDSAGVMQTAATNAPRFDYDPVALTPKGLLIEEQRTNLLTYSASIGGTNWILNNASASLGAANGLDGTATASKITETAVLAAHDTRQLATTTAESATYTVFAKAGERSRLLIRESTSTSAAAAFDLVSGTVLGSESGGTGAITNCGDGWYRCTMTHTATAGSRAYAAFILPDSGTSYADAPYLGVAGSGLYLWGAQLEQASFATSYIKTEAAAVTRGADDLSTTSVPWFNASAWSALIEADIIGLRTDQQGAFYFNDGTFNNQTPLHVKVSGNHNFRVVSGGVSVSYVDMATWSVGVTTKAAVAYAAGATGRAAINGTGYTGSLTSAAPIGINRLRLGSDGAYNINGHIRNFKYWNKALSATQLQAVTR